MAFAHQYKSANECALQTYDMIEIVINQNRQEHLFSLLPSVLGGGGV